MLEIPFDKNMHILERNCKLIILNVFCHKDSCVVVDKGSETGVKDLFIKRIIDMVL
jgi:hypothetical protein